MKKLLVAATVLAASFAFSSFAMAQETTPSATEPTNIPGHPRVDEVDHRDNNQQNRINQGEADGQLSKGQAARDQAHLDHEEAQQQHQEAEHGGHLTKAEQHHDNHRMNRSGGKIHHQRHGGHRHRR